MEMQKKRKVVPNVKCYNSVTLSPDSFMILTTKAMVIVNNFVQYKCIH